MVWPESLLERMYSCFTHCWDLAQSADSIVQAISTLIGGTVIGLAYAWKPALVGMGWFSSRLIYSSILIAFTFQPVSRSSFQLVTSDL